MTDFDAIDFFTDQSLVEDPYPYFEHLRAKCPVVHEQAQGTLMINGYDEISEVYRRTDDFSSCNSAIGPFAPFPTKPTGDDISDFIAENRDKLPMHEHFVTMDPPEHTNHRSLMMRLITPKRLKENEAFMWRLADRQLDEFIANGRCEFIKEYSQPFALLVVADVLGVPEEDHDTVRRLLGHQRPGDMASEGEHEWKTLNPLELLDELFIGYIEDRRREPRDDVLTDLATATFPDGTMPEPVEVSRIATFLFAAGQETTARLLGTALQVFGEHPELQERVRADRSLVPAFIEECLRFESPVKADFRLAKRTTTIGGVQVTAGTTVTLLNGAANRDPERFACPNEFDVDRPNVREHLAFGRGIHSCPGGPLARSEGRVSIERILDRMGDIRISEEHHGPAGARRWEYEPTFILRGLNSLHLEFTPLGGAT
jgi:cytochrome P450